MARGGAPSGPGRGPGQDVRPEDIRRWGPRWSRRVGWLLAHGLWDTHVLGAENVPATGRVLLASNHTGIIDGPLLHGCIPRPSHFIIKEEIFTGVLGFLMRGAGQIPVDRTSGRAALTTALALLEEERLVGVFPEGTRGRGDVSSAKAGIAWLALRSGAPVVPVAILGTRREGQRRGHVPAPRTDLSVVFGKRRGHVPAPRTDLSVVFGKPFHAAPAGSRTGRAALTAAMERVQEEMSRHVDAAVARTGVELPEGSEA